MLYPPVAVEVVVKVKVEMELFGINKFGLDYYYYYYKNCKGAPGARGLIKNKNLWLRT